MVFAYKSVYLVLRSLLHPFVLKMTHPLTLCTLPSLGNLLILLMVVSEPLKEGKSRHIHSIQYIKA